MRWGTLVSVMVLVACAPGGGTDAAVLGDTWEDGGFAPDLGFVSAALTSDPASVDFGNVDIGSPSAPQRVTIRNTGLGAASAVQLQLAGASATDFAIDATVTTCEGATLAPGASCVVSLGFEPSRDASAAAVLQVRASAASVDVPLTAEGVAACDLSVTPSPYDFADVTVGAASAPVTFTVTNPCRLGTTGALSVAIAGVDAAEFAMLTDDCTGITLASRASCIVDVHFAPTLAGPRSASLVATASPGGTASAALSGNGIF